MVHLLQRICRLLAFCLMPLCAQAATAATPVAFVEKVVPATEKLADAAEIRRNGRTVAISSNQIDLYAGDRVYVRDPNATIAIRIIATNARIAVHQRADRDDAADFIVPDPGVHSLGGKAFVWFSGLMRGADQSTGDVLAGSRGVGPCYNPDGNTNQPVRFDLPLLTAARSYLATGSRPIYVSWRGGASPFSVTLRDGTTGQVLAQQDVADACSVRLPPITVTPEKLYSLTVSDANGVVEQEDNLAGATLPAMPAVLLTANMPADDRNLYYATWLRLQPDHAWDFEAVQRVGAMDCGRAAVRQWLAAADAALACE